MITFPETNVMNYEDHYDEFETFERIRPKRETPMPVGSARSEARGRRRSQPPKRTHKAPMHCRGAAHKRIRKWK